MKKLVMGTIAAAALLVATPAFAQFGFYAGPGGVGVQVGPPYGYYDGPRAYYDRPYQYDRRYYRDRDWRDRNWRYRGDYGWDRRYYGGPNWERW
jgi:hypothetical protein